MRAVEIATFVEARRARWVELEQLLGKAEARGLSTLTLDEARALSRLYRASSADLLWVRAQSSSAEVTGYLNDLVARAYAVTYPGKKLRPGTAWRFLADGFPRVLRREWRVFIAAWLITLAGTGFGWIGMRIDPNAGQSLLPAEHLKLDPTERAKEEATRTVSTADQQAAFSSFLFTHNIQVAFLCFALGLTAGVGTALMLFINGLLLGALAYAYAARGLAGWFWAWILPHGIPELTAICIAGAAGFVLARGMIAPSGERRGVALRREATVALQLLLGTLALFVLAGLIEGTISQIHPPRLSVAFKISFALTVGSAVYAYLLSAFWRRVDVR